MDLYTKYEVSILNGYGDMFDEKVLRNYGRTDGRTDGTTDRCKPVYPPLFQSRGIIIVNIENKVAIAEIYRLRGLHKHKLTFSFKYIENLLF